MSVTQQAEQLREDFAFLDDWEARFQHLIDLGKALPDMDPALKTAATKVNGCASQVWIHSRVESRDGLGCLRPGAADDGGAHRARAGAGPPLSGPGSLASGARR